MVPTCAVLPLLATLLVSAAPDEETPSNFAVSLKEGEVFPVAALEALAPVAQPSASRFTLVYFTSGACKPCRYTTPLMSKLRERHPQGEVKMIAVVIHLADYPVTKVEIEEKVAPKGWQRVDLPEMDHPFLARARVQSVPDMYLLDEQGRILATRSAVRSAARSGTLERLLMPHHGAR